MSKMHQQVARRSPHREPPVLSTHIANVKAAMKTLQKPIVDNVSVNFIVCQKLA